jgi:hypothetical protein
MIIQEAHLSKPNCSRRRSINEPAISVGPSMPRTESTHRRLIVSYIHGWATANPAKIRTATAPPYCFTDPLVGDFSRWSLGRYFEHLREVFGIHATERRSAIHFNLWGPMDGLTFDGEYLFWREAPQLGLTGLASLLIGTQGVIAEHVCYDLSLATEMLRTKDVS